MRDHRSSGTGAWGPLAGVVLVVSMHAAAASHALDGYPPDRFASAFLAFASGGFATAIASADFNTDGCADFAVANYGSNDVSIFLGTGSRVPRLRADLSVGTNARSIAAADFDTDGRADLVVLHETGAGTSLSVLRGGGDGAFDVQATFAANVGASNVAVANLDGDGNLDLAAVSDALDAVLVWPGDGAGGFGAPQSLALDSNLRAAFVAVADLNSDGASDLVVTNEDGYSVHVLLGNRAGGFGEPAMMFSNGAPRSLTIADVNGDSRVDLAVANATNATILLGRGDGSFEPPRLIDVHRPGVWLRQIGVLDTNGDMAPDLLLVWEDGVVTVHDGRGDGSFDEPRLFSAGWLAGGIAVVDADRDGHLDVALATGTVSILFGNGDGTFGRDGKIHARGPISAVAHADVNHDGRLDVLLAYHPSGPDAGDRIAVHLGIGGESFLPMPELAAPRTTHLATGDVDDDGDIDLVAGGDSLAVYLGTGDGGLVVGARDPEPLERVQLADLDADGVLDLVSGRLFAVHARRGRGDGSFELPVVIGERRTPWFYALLTGLQVVDLDRDGFLDVLASWGSTYHAPVAGGLGVIAGRGDGTFEPQVVHESDGWSVGAFGVGRLNADSHLDALVPLYFPGHPGTRTRRIAFFGTGNRSFAPEVAVDGGLAGSIAIHDVDSNDLGDVIEAQGGHNHVRVAHGNGDGSFGPSIHFGAGRDPREVLIVDLNSDGREDLLVKNEESSYCTILWNRGDPSTPIFVADLAAVFDAGMVRLSWRLDLTAVAGVSGIDVERSETAAGPYERNTRTPLEPRTLMNFDDADVEAGARYWYRLRISTAAGEEIAGPVEVAAGPRSETTTLGTPVVADRGTSVSFPFTLGTFAAVVQLDVLDVRGRRVRALIRSPLAAGSHVERWDRRDAAGRRAARGVYMVRLRGAGAGLSRKFLLIR